jgi:perosamine synthetase
MQKLAINGGIPTIENPRPRLSVIGEEERKAILRVLDDGQLSGFRGGPYVREFEKKFADFIGVDHAVATTSGTTALHASVAALNLPRGSEVLVPAVTFVSSASVVLQESHNVVFVDIEYGSYCLNTDDLESKITPKTAAIIPVHLYGNACDMTSIMELASEHGLAVVEDAAQAHGAMHRNQKVGSFGDFGCFSFFETKNMTTGEGGMSVTNDSELASRVQRKREHGSPADSSTWYDYRELGYNYNMTEVQGGIGTVQLGKLENLNAGRRERARWYTACFKNSKYDLELLQEPQDSFSVYHNFPVLVPKKFAPHRDFIVRAMRAEGIPIDVAYPSPLYKTHLFESTHSDIECPVSEDVTSRLLTFFTDASIEQDTVAATAEALDKVLAFLD